MAGMFDDLIPPQPATGGNAPPTPQAGMFDDLIPQQVSGVTQGVTAPLRIQMGNPPSSDSTQPATAPRSAPWSMDRLSELWQNPPAGPSLIGTARSLYDAVMTPGNVMKAAEDNAKKTQITDSDLPLSSGTLAAPAMNMARNIFLPAPGPGISLSVAKQAEAPAYGTNAAQKKAAEIVSAPLKGAGLDNSQAVEDALTKIGPEAVLADVDPRLTQMAGTIAGTPGPGQQVVRNALESRNNAATSRIVGTMNDVLGQPINLAETGKQIYTAGRTAAAPLWDQAYQVPIQSAPELQQALATPAGQTAIRRAAILAANDPNGAQSIMFSKQPATPVTALPDWAQAALQKGGVAADSIRSQFPDIGAASSGGSVDVRGLHLIRQAFDDMIYRGKNPTTSAGKNALSGLMRNRAVVDSVLKQVEPMAQADKIFASQAQINEAMAEGLNIFKGGANAQMPEDVADLVNGMSDAEKAAYLQGVRVAARKLMGTARNAPLAARNTLQTEFNQEKLAAALGPDEASKILGRIGAETKYSAADQLILRNSQTFNRAAGREALQDAHGIPSFRDVAIFSGKHGIARRAVIGGINNVLDAAASRRQQAIEEEVAKLLTLGRNDRAPILQALYQEGLKRDPSGGLNRMIVPFVLQRATAPSLLQSQ